MTTTPPTGPAWSVRAEYASISSPLCPVIVTLSASIASYIARPFSSLWPHHDFTGPPGRREPGVKDFRHDYTEDIARVADQIAHLYRELTLGAVAGKDVRSDQEALQRAEDELGLDGNDRSRHRDKMAIMTYLAALDRYDQIPYRRCGRSGVKLPEISLGLWQNFGDDRPLTTQRAIIRRAFDLGVTHFDLANNYGGIGPAEILRQGNYGSPYGSA